MKFYALLPLLLLLQGCLMDADDPIVPPNQQLSQLTTVCLIEFPDKNGSVPVPAGGCPAGSHREAVGFMVTPIKGECEGAFITLHEFRQLWGCVPDPRPISVEIEY